MFYLCKAHLPPVGSLSNCFGGIDGLDQWMSDLKKWIFFREKEKESYCIVDHKKTDMTECFTANVTRSSTDRKTRIAGNRESVHFLCWKAESRGSADHICLLQRWWKAPAARCSFASCSFTGMRCSTLSRWSRATSPTRSCKCPGASSQPSSPLPATWTPSTAHTQTTSTEPSSGDDWHCIRAPVLFNPGTCRERSQSSSLIELVQLTNG